MVKKYSQDDFNMHLTTDELDLLNGKKGNVFAKVMESVVLFGEAMSAECLVEINGPGHFSLGDLTPGTSLRPELLKILIEAGLKTRYSFTLDPYYPIDFENLFLSDLQKKEISEIYKDKDIYDQMMLKVGLRDKDAYSCTCYLPQMNNIPSKGDIVAWSESSAVVYANSVLGARTNRNAAIMDIFQNIVGKTPKYGLLIEENRKADWLIDIQVEKLPPAQLLGAIVGETVVEDVPYIVGLDKWIGESMDYLKNFGAACAALGAVGLYHVEGVTPEAKLHGKDLLTENYQVLTITNEMIDDKYLSYPNRWNDASAKPDKCFIGCPHLSIEELVEWTSILSEALLLKGSNQLSVPTIFCAAPYVIDEFIKMTEYKQLKKLGATLTSICPETLLGVEACMNDAIITNSNKLRDVTTAKLYKDDELIKLITGGENESI